jgi:hypothetical protein
VNQSKTRQARLLKKSAKLANPLNNMDKNGNEFVRIQLLTVTLRIHDSTVSHNAISHAKNIPHLKHHHYFF